MKSFNDKRSKPSPITFFTSESAMSSAVEAILLLAIVFSIFSVIQIGYIPEWKADGEHSHMVDLWEDMTKLKSKIDRASLILMSKSAPDQNSHPPPIITTIPIRNSIKDIPVFGSSKSAGTLSVNVGSCTMIVTANNNSQGINCGTIAYHSNNNYYMDQVFAYENGALILDQREKAVMKKYPMIRIYEAPSGGYNFFINAISMEEKSTENTVSANSDCSIRLKDGSFSSNTSYPSSFMLDLYSEYPEAWEMYFNDTMSKAGLEKDVDYTLNTNGIDHLTLSFPKAGSHKSIRQLYIGKSSIGAELLIS